MRMNGEYTEWKKDGKIMSGKYEHDKYLEGQVYEQQNDLTYNLYSLRVDESGVVKYKPTNENIKHIIE